MEVVSDRCFAFDADRATVWEAIARVDEYPTRWSWLRGFEAEGMLAGDEWRCTVQPPLPYRLRFRVRLDEVQPGELVAATVTGDLAGTARLTLRDLEAGSEVRLTSRLAPAHPVVRGVATVAGPLARFGHDWVLRTGLRQFAQSLPGSPSPGSSSPGA